MKYGGKNANSMKWKRRLKMNNKPTHGGKRSGSGRKPIDSPVDNTPIYCGDMEKELREAVMDLDPKARKFALASLVKMEMARCTNDRGLFIVALRDVIRDWEGMQDADLRKTIAEQFPEHLPNTVEQSRTAPIFKKGA